MNKIFTVALSALVVAAIMTSVVFQIASASTSHSHQHFNENKNSEHFNEVAVGNSDGSHHNEHCVENSNNDKGQVCHTNDH